MVLLLGLVRGMPLKSLLRRLRHHTLKRWEWTILASLGVVLLLLILLPGLLRRAITARLAAVTPAEVHIADVGFNPFRGRLALQGLALTLKDEEKPVITIGELVGNLRVLSLLRGQVSLEEVQLSGLQVAAIQQADGQLNLKRLLPPSPPSETPPPESDLPTLNIERFDLSAAEIDYQDRTRTPPAHFTLTIKDLAAGEIGLQAKGLATPVTVRLQGSLGESPVHGEGQVFWQRTQTTVEADIEAQRLALGAVEPYLRDALTLQRLSGFVGARLRYRYLNGGDQSPQHLMGGTLKLEGVSFADPLSGQTALDLPSGQVAIETIDLLAHEIRLATVEFHTPKLFFLQSASGLNWTALVRIPNHTPQNEAPQPRTAPDWRFLLQEARLTGGELVYRDSTWLEAEALTLTPEEIQIQHVGNETEDSPLHFRLRLGEGTLTGEGGLRLAPFRFQTQVQFTGIGLASLRPVLMRALTAENVGGTISGAVKAELTTPNGAQIVTVSGVVETTALALAGVPQSGSAVAWDSGHIELSEGSTVIPLNLGLSAQLSRLSVQHLPQGDVSIEKIGGNLRFVQEERASGKTAIPRAASPEQTPLSIKARGTLDVSSFLLTHGSEKQEQLSCFQARAKLNDGSRLLPLDLRLGDVTLEYPYAQGFRTAAGQFQLFTPSSPASLPTPPPPVPSSDIPLSPTPPAQASASALTSSPAVHLDRITLIGGQLYFEDHLISPPQTVYWQDLRIDLSDVGYPLSRPAAFTLHAFNMDGAPIDVQGTTQRQADQLLTRVHGKIERLSLPRFNAYFAPLLGYRVRNGAVSVTWDLTMPGDQMQATTTVTLHDLGLSGKQGSSVLEEEVGLPLHLVIALLKDLNGDINLQLPVAGRFGDPAFRLGGTILRAVRDVLLGAVTSPLKLLGAVISGKEKIEDFSLEPIGFVPGTNQPNNAGKEQLARLGRFLAQRPELDLQLSGHTGPDDLPALKDRLVLVQLQEDASPAKAPNAAEAGQEGATPQVTPQEEVRQFLAHQFDQSGDGAGAPPALSAQATALLTQLRERVVMSPQAMAQLSLERVQTVMNTLTATAALTASRLRLSPDKLRGREGAEVRYMVQARETR